MSAEPNQELGGVNMPMIRQWVEAFDDRNPIQEDAGFAANTRFCKFVGCVFPDRLWNYVHKFERW